MIRTALVVLAALWIGGPAAAAEVLPLASDAPRVRIIFTGHTYSLALRDLQFHLAQRIRSRQPDFVIFGGDVVTGSDTSHLKHGVYNDEVRAEQWAKFDLLRERVGVPSFYLPGNHDFYGRGLPRDPAAVLSRYGRIERAYSARSFGHALLVFLNTVDITAPAGERPGPRLDEAQLAWLRGLLRDTQARTVLLFMHHQLWNLRALPGAQGALDPEQFAREIEPLLGRFAEVWLFAGDSSHPETTRGNLRFRVWANSFVELGFWDVLLDRATGGVEASLVRERIEPGEIRLSYLVRSLVRELPQVDRRGKLQLAGLGLAGLAVLALLGWLGLRARRLP